MKKLLLIILIVFISTISFAQIHAKVTVGRQDHDRHYVHHYHHTYVQHNYYHRRHYNRGSHVVIKARL